MKDMIIMFEWPNSISVFFDITEYIYQRLYLKKKPSINQWSIKTENNQNCIWFVVNFIQSRQTFLYGIYLAI